MVRRAPWSAVFVAVLTLAGGLLPGLAEGSSFSGLCNHVVNDTGSNLPVVDLTIQYNGSTWVLAHEGPWQLLSPGGAFTSCVYNFVGVTFKETWFWDYSSQTPFEWTWAASTLVNAAAPN